MGVGDVAHNSMVVEELSEEVTFRQDMNGKMEPVRNSI